MHPFFLTQFIVENDDTDLTFEEEQTRQKSTKGHTLFISK